jgi:hypothetical protein
MKFERDKPDTIETIPAYASVNAARGAGELSADRSSQRGLAGSICSQDSPLLAFSDLPTGLLRMSLSQILTVIRSRSIKIRSEDSAIDLQPLAMRTVIIQ